MELVAQLVKTEEILLLPLKYRIILFDPSEQKRFHQIYIHSEEEEETELNTSVTLPAEIEEMVARPSESKHIAARPVETE